MSFYYLIRELPDKRMEAVNEKYAPQYGLSTHFSPQEIANVMGVKVATAKRRIERWMIDDHCREVVHG